MRSFHFSKYNPNESSKSSFEKLFDIFTQLLTHTSGDYNEAIQWLTELDKEYKLTDNEYGIGDFIEDLKSKGYIDEYFGRNKKAELNYSKAFELGKSKVAFQKL